MKKIARIVGLIAVFALIFIAVITSNVKPADVSGEIWNQEMTLGDPVTAVRHYIVYTDLMCPYCNYYSHALQEEQEDFEKYLEENKIAYEVRVTDMLYEGSSVEMSLPAAEGAYCAARENRFWDYYHASIDHIFEDYYLKGYGYSKTAPMITGMTRDYWYDIGKEIGLGDTFKTCFKEKLAVSEVQENTYRASNYANGLPYFNFGKYSSGGFDPSWDWDVIKSVMFSKGLK
jgi:hypothetical protein